MSSNYEIVLSEYTNSQRAIALLRQHRFYLEMLPSIRRPQESLITIPLPVVRIRKPKNETGYRLQETVELPCDLAILMCDPEWKIKMEAEIPIFIHRPHEDFSDLLRRWRQTQVLLDREYEWLMPEGEEHMFSEVVSKIYPLFIVFEETSERIKQGLTNANLPFVTYQFDLLVEKLAENCHKEV